MTTPERNATRFGMLVVVNVAGVTESHARRLASDVVAAVRGLPSYYGVIQASAVEPARAAAVLDAAGLAAGLPAGYRAGRPPEADR